MDDKTKKKRVTAEKRSVRKKRDESEPAAVEAIAPAKIETKKIETKKVRKSAKPKSVTKKSVIVEPTFEQIQLRAYFIAERRTQLGIAGNEHQDWLAAERELREELKC